MKIGITSGIYLNHPISEIINMVAAAGYDGLDFWCGRPQIYRDDYSEMELIVFRKQMDDLGLDVPSLLPAFYRYPHSLSNPNGKIREDSVNYMKICVKNAAVLAAPIVLVVPGMSMIDQNPADAWKLMVECVDSICRYASQFDLKLGIEPVNHFVSDLVNTSSDAVRMIEELNHDNLGIVLDTGHIHLSSESIQEAIQLTGEHLLQIHVNDNDGINQQNLVPGDGSFNFMELIKILKAEKFQGYLTAELAYHYMFEPEQPVQATINLMRRLIS